MLPSWPSLIYFMLFVSTRLSIGENEGEILYHLIICYFSSLLTKKFALAFFAALSSISGLSKKKHTDGQSVQ